jgi:hypothetical protein
LRVALDRPLLTFRVISARDFSVWKLNDHSFEQHGLPRLPKKVSGLAITLLLAVQGVESIRDHLRFSAIDSA